MILRQEVPGRRGWELGETVSSASGSRCAVQHIETGRVFWAFGGTPEERLQAAHDEIDRIYQENWDQLADVIEEGDRRGPNVRSLDDLLYPAP